MNIQIARQSLYVETQRAGWVFLHPLCVESVLINSVYLHEALKGDVHH